MNKILLSLGVVGSTLSGGVLKNNIQNTSPQTNNEPTSRIVYDGNNETYKVYEFDKGYELYKIQDDVEHFIESSEDRTSPYKDLSKDVKCYYGGYGNYYYSSNEVLYDCYSHKQSNLSIDNLKPYLIPFDVEEESEEFNIHSLRSVKSSKIQVEHKIPHYKFFEKLDTFPYNSNGTCGLTAIAMLLSYHDTFNNKYLINNDFEYYYNTYEFKKVDINKVNANINFMPSFTDVEVKHSEYKYPIFQKGMYKGKDPKNIDNWIKSPGLNTNFADYLYDNYSSSMFGIVSSRGYPMANEEIKSTIEKYMKGVEKQYSSSIKTNFDKCLIYTSAGKTATCKHLKNDINAGLPSILTTSVTVDADGYNFHNVIVYGYDKRPWLETRFLVHNGWQGHNKSNDWITWRLAYSRVTMDVAGEPGLSENMKGDN